jgi:hypothetical protein
MSTPFGKRIRGAWRAASLCSRSVTAVAVKEARA